MIAVKKPPALRVFFFSVSAAMALLVSASFLFLLYHSRSQSALTSYAFAIDDLGVLLGQAERQLMLHETGMETLTSGAEREEYFLEPAALYALIRSKDPDGLVELDEPDSDELEVETGEILGAYLDAAGVDFSVKAADYNIPRDHMPPAVAELWENTKVRGSAEAALDETDEELEELIGEALVLIAPYFMEEHAPGSHRASLEEFVGLMERDIAPGFLHLREELRGVIARSERNRRVAIRTLAFGMIFLIFMTVWRIFLPLERQIVKSWQELQKSANALKNANDLLAEIMKVAPNGVLLCTKDFVIGEANPAAERQLGISKSELLGRRLDDLLPGASTALPRDNGGEFFLERSEAVRANGDRFPVEIHGYAGPINKDYQYLLFVHDMTEREQAKKRREQIEQQMEEARRLESVGALAAGVAHEINTPMQYLGDNIEYLNDALTKIHTSYTRYDVLKEAAAQDDNYRNEVHAIVEFNNSVNLLSLIKEIMAAMAESREGIQQVRDIVLLMKKFAHPGTGDMEEVDLNEIARNVIAISKYRYKGNAEVELDLAEDLPGVLCHRGQIQQVLLNIALNAADAVDEAKPDNGRIRLQTSFDDAFVKIAISDNGNGVPESLRQKIFDPFFTTKPVGKGTGQGLALAKDSIVKVHGGRLRLTDVDGFSTTFFIELPRKSEMSKFNREGNDVFAA